MNYLVQAKWRGRRDRRAQTSRATAPPYPACRLHPNPSPDTARWETCARNHSPRRTARPWPRVIHWPPGSLPVPARCQMPSTASPAPAV